MVIPASNPLSGASRSCRPPAPTALLLAIALGLAAGGLLVRSGVVGSDHDKRSRRQRQAAPAASVRRTSATPRPCQRAARCWRNPARPRKRWPNSIRRSRSIRTTRRPCKPRPDLSGPESASAGDRGFYRGQWPAPQRAEPLLGRATSYLAIDKSKEAAADLDEAVQADPNSAQAWTTRGLAYERLGDKDKAAASYGRAIVSVPRTKPRAAGWRASAASRSMPR